MQTLKKIVALDTAFDDVIESTAKRLQKTQEQATLKLSKERITAKNTQQTALDAQRKADEAERQKSAKKILAEAQEKIVRIKSQRTQEQITQELITGVHNL